MVDPLITQSFLPLYPAMETFQARPGCAQPPEAQISTEIEKLLKGAVVPVTSKGE